MKEERCLGDERQMAVWVKETLLPAWLQTRKLLITGEMGAGKTTLVRQLIAALAPDVEATSPTYALVHDYPTAEGPVHHLDLYRLEDDEELWDIGLEDLLESGDLMVVEWPEMMMPYVTPPYLHLQIANRADLRAYTLQMHN